MKLTQLSGPLRAVHPREKSEARSTPTSGTPPADEAARATSTPTNGAPNAGDAARATSTPTSGAPTAGDVDCVGAASASHGADTSEQQKKRGALPSFGSFSSIGLIHNTCYTSAA